LQSPGSLAQDTCYTYKVRRLYGMPRSPHKVGSEKWKETRSKLLGLPIEIVAADRELSELAGEIKVQHKMSLADCFAAALAKQTKGKIFTGDPEFRSIESEVKVIWL